MSSIDDQLDSIQQILNKNSSPTPNSAEKSTKQDSFTSKTLKNTQKSPKNSPKNSILDKDSREFKRLQMQWYCKLDTAGFDDIERTGLNRQKYFDEYGGILKDYAYKKIMKHDDFALSHYHICQSYSWELKDVLDRRVLFLYGEGKTIKEISSYCRRFFWKRARLSRRGPKGQAFSVFWVHRRVQKLVDEAHAWHRSNLQDPGEVKNWSNPRSQESIEREDK